MNSQRISMQQAQSQYISFLINQIGIKKLFPYFTNTDVITCLRQRNLHQFLLNIPSQQLRSAMQERQQRQDQQAAQRTIMKYNVLDFTLKELVKHCWDNRLIDYHHYKNQVYTMNNFYQLAMRLVNRIPGKYEVGKRSHHFNKWRQIQEMFGIKREDDQQDQFNQGQQQQYQQQDQDQVIFEQQNVENDNQSQFVNDVVQQSNYDIVSEEQESLQQQNQQDEQIQSVKKKTKKKLIKKQKKSKNTRKNMKINQPRKKLRKIVVNNQDQQQNIKNNQQIFESQQQYQNQKNQPKTQAKCNKNNNKKKNTIDSGDEN